MRECLVCVFLVVVVAVSPGISANNTPLSSSHLV